MTDNSGDTRSDDSTKGCLTPEALMNLLVKAIGLYWFIYGVLMCIETLHAWYLGRVNNMTVYADSQPYSVLWGGAMLAIGACLVVYSKWITRLAYSFDARSELPTGAVEQNGPPKPPTSVS